MLKVGRIEVLQVLPWFLHLIVERSGVPPDARSARGWRWSGPIDVYKNALGSESCDVDYDVLGAVDALAPIAEAHRRIIGIAAKSPRHTSTANDHSEGVLLFLEGELGTSLPRPSYHNPAPRDADGVIYLEGERRSVVVTRAERDPKARGDCLAEFGHRCAVCGFEAKNQYGPLAPAFIEVHHLIPLSDADGPREVNPSADLRPLCPNCHTMVHTRTPPYTLDELDSMMRSATGKDAETLSSH